MEIPPHKNFCGAKCMGGDPPHQFWILWGGDFDFCGEGFVRFFGCGGGSPPFPLTRETLLMGEDFVPMGGGLGKIAKNRQKLQKNGKNICRRRTDTFFFMGGGSPPLKFSSLWGGIWGTMGGDFWIFRRCGGDPPPSPPTRENPAQ